MRESYYLTFEKTEVQRAEGMYPGPHSKLRCGAEGAPGALHFYSSWH